MTLAIVSFLRITANITINEVTPVRSQDIGYERYITSRVSKATNTVYIHTIRKRQVPTKVIIAAREDFPSPLIAPVQT